MAELTEDQVKDILQGISIPSQPQIMVDLQIEEIMPDPDINRIAELISQDVGLAGTVLKVVNSAAFATEEPTLSVEEGVKRLGIKTIISITNGLSIKGEMSDEFIRSMNRFWDTANDVGAVSLSLAQQFEFPRPEEAYVLGLFTTVAYLLLLARFNHYMDVMVESYSGKYPRIIDAENDALKTNHAVLGYYTAKAWNIPKPFATLSQTTTAPKRSLRITKTTLIMRKRY
jgi:HD-like signal output (HDOD) protein